MRYCLTIKGRVQGVYFRQHTFETALDLNIKGFVQNLEDGSVYCEAEGNENDLQNFLDLCAMGSPMSDVKSIDVEMKEKVGFKIFEVRR